MNTNNLSLSPKVITGLAKYGDDYHAILGAPLNADERQVRRAYLKVAKALHPDGFAGREGERALAAWLFSKLISPANEVMSRDRERTEYLTILKLRTKQLLTVPASEIWPKTAAAQSLIGAANLDATYTDTVYELATTLYQDLPTALERIGELSQLNLAYLLLSNNFKPPAPPKVAAKSLRPPSQPIPNAGSARYNPAQPPPAKPEVPSSPVQPVASAKVPTPEPAKPVEFAPDPGRVRFDQAMSMMERSNYREAIQFLNFAISADPNQSEYYLQRGIAHQETGNIPLARPDFRRAIMLDPDNTEAQARLKAIASRPRTEDPASKAAANRPEAKSESKKGLFGRFFNR